MNDPVRYGLIGCGGFGRFCLEQYGTLDTVDIVAVADTDRDAAHHAASEAGVESCTPAEMLSRTDVDLVHVATPPFTHRELVLSALRGGKHVLCEKPLALTADDAREMIDAARQARRVLAVNLIMRYDPLCRSVEKIIDRRLLGAPLHAFFENYAKDEPLPPGHWFWDPDRSGGIFIEHAVHFFDLFESWFGAGHVTGAQAVTRPGLGAVDQVTASVRYPHGVTGQFYHGFTQASRMDRQEMRVVCELGSISMDEWVPSRMHIDALVSEATAARLADILPGSRTDTVEEYQGDQRTLRARHVEHVVDRRVHIEHDVGMTKLELYGAVLRDLLEDQVRAIADPGHARRITERNGLSSLEYALEADRIARLTAGDTPP